MEIEWNAGKDSPALAADNCDQDDDLVGGKAHLCVAHRIHHDKYKC